MTHPSLAMRISRQIKEFSHKSLKNKIFFSILVVILIISATIALLARWILVSSLSSELQLRGIAIAHSIAERGGGYVLDKNYPKLLALIFDEATLLERQHMINYIYVTDRDNKVLSHTLSKPFPDKMARANQVGPGQDNNVVLMDFDRHPTYDIAVPIKEGIYRIGTVHVGLSKQHMDNLVSKLRITFLGFISAVIVIIFLISHKLAQNITRPLTKLTSISDEISKGNFDTDIKLDIGEREEGWDASQCPAYRDSNVPCWHFDEQSRLGDHDHCDEVLHNCKNCVFYHKREGDEVLQLADSFMNMVWSIRLYRKRLQESEGKYRSLFDSGPDPIFVLESGTYSILDANRRTEEIYGFGKKELIGTSFLDLGPEQTEEFINLFEQNDQASDYVQFAKMIQYKKDKSPFYVNAHACPISYKGKQAIIVSATDITEIIEKDAQLIQASKMKTLGEMSAGIAHELNQPLNAIKMGSEFLEMSLEDDRDIPKDLFNQVAQDISRQVDRATDIINNLRAFGRKSTLFRERIDINKPIEGVLSIVRRQFLLEKINFDLHLGTDLPLIVAHDNRLQQVFFNLITNARDAIVEKKQKTGEDLSGRITVTTDRETNRVVVRIGDNGIGIPDEVITSIFEPFFTTKATGQGMGLGLAITYGIIKDYNGDIQIQSTPGRGTDFTISFPVAEELETNT
ncbi:ATP-binding protein [Desulfoplanes sp.]